MHQNKIKLPADMNGNFVLQGSGVFLCKCRAAGIIILRDLIALNLDVEKSKLHFCLTIWFKFSAKKNHIQTFEMLHLGYFGNANKH